MNQIWVNKTFGANIKEKGVVENIVMKNFPEIPRVNT